MFSCDTSLNGCVWSIVLCACAFHANQYALCVFWRVCVCGGKLCVCFIFICSNKFCRPLLVTYIIVSSRLCVGRTVIILFFVQWPIGRSLKNYLHRLYMQKELLCLSELVAADVFLEEFNHCSVVIVIVVIRSCRAPSHLKNIALFSCAARCSWPEAQSGFFAGNSALLDFVLLQLICTTIFVEGYHSYIFFNRRLPVGKASSDFSFA